MTGKYDAVADEAVKRIAAAESAKGRSSRETDKAVKNVLHQITGAFAEPGDMKRAKRLIEGELSDGALDELLLCHASTRERAPIFDDFCARVIAPLGAETLLDLACGLNPIALGRRGYAVTGFDLNGACVDIVNACAERLGLRINAVCRDLFAVEDWPRADVALCMKLLPLLERQEKGASSRLMRRLTAPRLVVTFPLATLSGRRVGMDRQYSEWFESLDKGSYVIADRVDLPGEMCYSLVRREG